MMPPSLPEALAEAIYGSTQKGRNAPFLFPATLCHLDTEATLLLPCISVRPMGEKGLQLLPVATPPSPELPPPRLTLPSSVPVLLHHHSLRFPRVLLTEPCPFLKSSQANRHLVVFTHPHVSESQFRVSSRTPDTNNVFHVTLGIISWGQVQFFSPWSRIPNSWKLWKPVFYKFPDKTYTVT